MIDVPWRRRSGHELRVRGPGMMRSYGAFFVGLATARPPRATVGAGQSPAVPPNDRPWARVNEDDRAIKIETDKLEAVIPKRDPKQWMTGIEKGSFLDKVTGFREVGDGLMVVDWLMEAGSDEAWSDQVIAPDGHGVGRYTWY